MPPSGASRQTAPPAAATTARPSGGELTDTLQHLGLVVPAVLETPGPVAAQLPAADVRGQGGLEDAGQLGGGGLVAPGEQALAPPVEVAVHEVGAADPELPVTVVEEAHHAGVLEVPADD